MPNDEVDMDRRGFLKRIGQTVAGLTGVLGVAKAKEPKLTPNKYYLKITTFEGEIVAIIPIPDYITEEVPDFSFFITLASDQDIIRSDEEYDEFIKAYLKRYNFPKEQLMD